MVPEVFQIIGQFPSSIHQSSSLTKLLANRLQTVITKLVHRNQYGFIKDYTRLPSLVSGVSAPMSSFKEGNRHSKARFWEGFWQDGIPSNAYHNGEKVLWTEMVTTDATNFFFSDLSSPPKWNTRKDFQLFKRSETRWPPLTSPLCVSCWLSTVTGEPRQRARATQITNSSRNKQWLSNNSICRRHIDHSWGGPNTDVFF